MIWQRSTESVRELYRSRRAVEEQKAMESINCMFGIRTREAVTRAKGEDYCRRICGELGQEHLTRNELENQIARTGCAAICKKDEKEMREWF